MVHERASLGWREGSQLRKILLVDSKVLKYFKLFSISNISASVQKAKLIEVLIDVAL